MGRFERGLVLKLLSFSEGKSELGFSQNMVVVGFDRVDWL